MSEAVTQKEFFEEVTKLREEMHKVTITMTKTTTLIRDYNGLRGTIDDVDDRVQALENKFDNKKENKNHIGWLIGCIGGIMGILGTAFAIYMQIK